jgi:hypothetical protein
MAFFIRYFFVFNSVLYIPANILLYAGLMFFYLPMAAKLPASLGYYLLFAAFILFLKMTYELKIQKTEIALLKTFGLTALELALLRLVTVAVYLSLGQALFWVLDAFAGKQFLFGQLFEAAVKLLLIETALGLTWYPLYTARDLRPNP